MGAGEGTPNHDEWVRQKERERDDVKHLAMLKKKKEKRVAEKAKEVAQATFDCWVKKKSRYEKVQQLLKKEILIKRASEDESWREISIFRRAWRRMQCSSACSRQGQNKRRAPATSEIYGIHRMPMRMP